MKKSTIITLILSVILIVSGFVMMKKGVALADEEGTELFRQQLTNEGDLVETIELTDETMNKISVNLKDTDVNIIGDSEKSYVEIVNFHALEYTAYSSGGIFVIENDIFNTVVNQFVNDGIKFNGFRDYFRFNKHNSHKEINIYLSSELPVNKIELSLHNGNVNVSNFKSKADFTVKGNECEVTFRNTAKASKINLDVKKGSVLIDGLIASRIEAVIGEGNMTYNEPEGAIFSRRLVAEIGSIFIFGEKFGNRFEFEEDSDKNPKVLDVCVSVGDIIITRSEAVPVTESEPNENKTEETVPSETSAESPAETEAPPVNP